MLHRLGMLEYRAFELTQTNLQTLASQHLPGSTALVNKERFDAPDLLLPSMQKPVVKPAGEEDEDEDYGEEYDDTRTFTVKDFKEQALRYAKDHYSTNTTQTGTNADISHSNPFIKH